MKNALFALLLLTLMLRTATGYCQTGSTSIPIRDANAIKGEAFMEKIKDMALDERERRIYKEITTGNIPDSHKKWIKISETLTDADGASHLVEFQVLPDFLSIGSDDDFCRIPMLPETAQRIADKFGAILPTSKLSDLIHKHAVVKITPRPMTPDKTMTTIPVFIAHNREVEKERVSLGKPLDALIAGHKKDIVISNHFATHAHPVIIYGWHYPDGKRIQPVYAGHGGNYVDYSHGVRLVKDEILIDGVSRKIRDVLRDPVLFKLISDETEVFSQTEYPMIFIPVTCANGYKNPVIPGFHPDPSVCRVNDDYYLVTSSFEYFPGVPIFHSKDLINWKQIGHCLTRKSQLKLYNVAPSGGIYAPTIRYNNGRFYMITTNVSDKGNFYVYSDDPAGEWSDPIWVDQGGIDPTLFFDDDKCYLLSIPDGIQLCEIDIETGKLLSTPRTLWRGTGGRYPEAPHLYKKDGWYYLLIAEGGTEYGHKVTIARSRNLYGPYENNPANPILTHINEHTQGSPIQGVGHADFIQAHDGSWWTVFLGFRPQSGNHHLLGRETFLAPVRWDTNAWPVINGNGTVSIDMQCVTLPQFFLRPDEKRNGFNNDKLGYEWNYLRNPEMGNYSLTERKGYLRLKPTTIKLTEFASPTFVGRRQQHIDFTATASLDFSSIGNKDEAGVTVFMRNDFHYDICVTKKNGEKTLLVKYHLGNMQHTEKEIPVSESQIFLRIKGDKDFYSFYYSTDDMEYHFLSRMNTNLLSTETAGGFTGILLGLYAITDNDSSKSYADFDWFEYAGD